MQICLSDWRVDLLRRAGLPFVMIGRTADCDGLCYVDPDFDAAVTTVMDHLTGLGHRKIGYLHHPHARIEEGYGPARSAGGSVCPIRERPGPAEPGRAYGFLLCRILRGRPGRSPEGLRWCGQPPCLLSGDGVAGIIEAARQAGRRVPEDFSVVSLLCAERVAMSMLPSLTSVVMGNRSHGVHQGADAHQAS